MRAGLLLAPIPVPGFIRSPVEAAARRLLQADGSAAADFLHPTGEEALVLPDSVSWQVFKNPVSLMIGGIAAVILELAEPRVRTGVWDYTSFRTDPLRRMRRTGLAAMVTVYGARSRAEAMIAGVRRMHEKVAGTTPKGAEYQANDPELLAWVQATAAFGFLEAYHTYVRPLSNGERDRFYREGTEAARLYGSAGAPTSEAELNAMFAGMQPHLETSAILFEFLEIMRTAQLLPTPLHSLQGTLVRAAVEILPAWARELLLLGQEWRLRPFEAAMVRLAGAAADRLVLQSSPAVQSCLRLGLPRDYLYRSPSNPL